MLNGIFRRTSLTAIAALTLVPASLWADTFLVTRFVDKNDGACDRDCSLREAVLAANQHPGFDAILLRREPTGCRSPARTRTSEPPATWTSPTTC